MNNGDSCETVKNYLMKKDLESLLIHAAGFHGHFCRGLAYGLVAGITGARQFGFENKGMEEVLAVVECNNCFVDGIQVVSGCTLGNNALIYHDLGKMAVTFISRNKQIAQRLVLKPRNIGAKDTSAKEREAKDLYQKLVRDRISDPRAQERMVELSRELSMETIKKPPEELFEMQEIPAVLPAFAPVYDSVTCDACGEDFMETRGAIRKGKQVCLACAKDDTFAVLGRGITFLKEARLL